MQPRMILLFLLASCAGTLIGYVNWEVYWKFNVIPSSAWPAIVSSPLAQAIHKASPSLDVLLVATVKALPLNISLGLIAGYLLPRIKFQRVYCYSVFLWPIAYFALGYFTISSLDSRGWAGTQALWRSWHDHRVIAFAIYSWFFLGLYASFIITKRRMAMHSGTSQAQDGTH